MDQKELSLTKLSQSGKAFALSNSLKVKSAEGKAAMLIKGVLDILWGTVISLVVLWLVLKVLIPFYHIVNSLH